MKINRMNSSYYYIEILMNATLNRTQGEDEEEPDTEHLASMKRALFITMNVLAFYLTYGTMFAMGCDVSWSQVKQSLKYPKYICLGLAGQYILMPPCGYLAIKLLNISDAYATGVIILTCSPGGGYSNIITYFINGEVWLSVVLTTLSTTLAFGVMPLNLWIYGRNGSFSIPYLQMVIALVLLNTFLSLGMIVKWKAPTIAVHLTRMGAISITAANFIWISIWTYLNPAFFGSQSLLLCGAVFLVLIISCIIVGLISYFLHCPVSVIKTLVIEAPFQSIGTAVTVSVISFSPQVAGEVQGYIFLYCLITTSIGVFPVGAYQFIRFIRTFREEKKIYSEVALTNVLD